MLLVFVFSLLLFFLIMIFIFFVFFVEELCLLYKFDMFIDNKSKIVFYRKCKNFFVFFRRYCLEIMEFKLMNFIDKS